ncbi:MAG: hypothetical protein U1C55_05965 [Smithellaceae bacterium]|nr:hypothetical protein [Smithellaceae bacterium]
MEQAVRSLPQAYKIIKEMNLFGGHLDDLSLGVLALGDRLAEGGPLLAAPEEMFLLELLQELEEVSSLPAVISGCIFS